MHCHRSRNMTLTVTAAVVLLVAPFASAEPMFSVRSGVNLDSNDPLLGAGLLAHLGDRWYANPNVEYTFGDRVDVLGLNADFHYDFPLNGSPYVWAGPGLAVLRRDYEPGGSDTDVGVNGVFGIGFRTHSGAVPYIQTKVTLADNSSGWLGVGVRF
jgi:hypothetical protein